MIRPTIIHYREEGQTSGSRDCEKSQAEPQATGVFLPFQCNLWNAGIYRLMAPQVPKHI